MLSCRQASHWHLELQLPALRSTVVCTCNLCSLHALPSMAQADRSAAGYLRVSSASLVQENKAEDDIELDTWTVRHLEEHARADEGGAADVDDLADGYELRALARPSVSHGWLEVLPSRTRAPAEASTAQEEEPSAAAEGVLGDQRSASGGSADTSDAERTGGGKHSGAGAAGLPAVWDPGLGAGQEDGLGAVGEPPEHARAAAAGDAATAVDSAGPAGQRDADAAEPSGLTTLPLKHGNAQGAAQGLTLRAGKPNGGAVPAPASPDSQAAAALASPARSYVRVEKGSEDEEEGPSTPPSCELGASAAARSPLRADAGPDPSCDPGSNPSTSPSLPAARPPWTPRRSGSQGSRSPRTAREEPFARQAAEPADSEPAAAAAPVPVRLPPLPCADAGSAEAEFCVAFINARLGGDPVLAGRLPLAGGAAALFSACRDGVLLWCTPSASISPCAMSEWCSLRMGVCLLPGCMRLGIEWFCCVLARKGSSLCHSF